MELVKAVDTEGTITVRKDNDLLIKENNQYITLRKRFHEKYDDMDHYMKTAHEEISLDKFTKNQQKQIIDDDYHGKFVYKIVMEKGEVLTHTYTFMGFNGKKIKLVPLRMSKKNRFTADPRKVIRTTWYYLVKKSKMKRKIYEENYNHLM